MNKLITWIEEIDLEKKATETRVIINNYILNQIGMLGIRY